MRSGLILVGIGIAVAACSSSSGTVSLLEPELRVRTQSGQIEPRAGAETDIALQIDVRNVSGETITLERIQLRTTPTSDVSYRQVSRTFDVEIPPGEVRTVELWVSATRTNPRGDARSPVMVRGTAIFSSPVGGFRKVFIEPVVEIDSRAKPRG